MIECFDCGAKFPLVHSVRVIFLNKEAAKAGGYFKDPPGERTCFVDNDKNEVETICKKCFLKFKKKK